MMANPTSPVKRCPPELLAWTMAIVPAGDPLNCCAYSRRDPMGIERASLPVRAFTWPRTRVRCSCWTTQTVRKKKHTRLAYQADLFTLLHCPKCNSKGWLYV